MNEYVKLNKKRKETIDALPLFFAFSNEQFNEALEKMGLDPKTDLHKVCKGPYGSFLLKADAKRIARELKRMKVEFDQALAGDKTGDGFIYDMFLYELKNHEYGYTGEVEETLDSLGFTWDEVQADPRLLHGLQSACLTIQEAEGW